MRLLITGIVENHATKTQALIQSLEYIIVLEILLPMLAGTKRIKKSFLLSEALMVLTLKTGFRTFKYL